MVTKYVLNKGFITLVDRMGDDDSILRTARVSTGAEKNEKRDRGLIRYLYRNAHTTPFEHVKFQFHVKAPIFVARQWMRHRTGSFNEASARYKALDVETYFPERFMKQSQKNHQGAEEEANWVLNEECNKWASTIYDKYKSAYEKFTAWGVAKEQARIVMPVGQYTEFFWSIDLHNLLKFIELRADSHAQYEIRVYAQAILEMLRDLDGLKYTMEIFDQMQEVKKLFFEAVNSDKELKKLPEYLRGFFASD